MSSQVRRTTGPNCSRPSPAVRSGVLLIAKLDRLTRNVAFIFTLRDSGAQFVCADMPEANTLTIGVMATMAQHEREVIGDRTRKALAEKKRAGFILGKPENLTAAAMQKGLAVRQQNARSNEHNRRAAALASSLRGAGQNWSEVARMLNEHGFCTRRGKRFQAVQVQRLITLYSQPKEEQDEGSDRRSKVLEK